MAMKRTTQPNDDETIDLVAEEEVIDLVEPPSTPRWGYPGRCPECRGSGYLDGIDMRSRVMHQHCTECGHRWATSEAELTQQKA